MRVARADAETLIDPEIVAIARRIVAGSIAPYDGARAIWERLAEDDAPYPQELAVFVGLASEWQDHERHRLALDRDIAAEARSLLDRLTSTPGRCVPPYDATSSISPGRQVRSNHGCSGP